MPEDAESSKRLGTPLFPEKLWSTSVGKGFDNSLAFMVIRRNKFKDVYMRINAFNKYLKLDESYIEVHSNRKEKCAKKRSNLYVIGGRSERRYWHIIPTLRSELFPVQRILLVDQVLIGYSIKKLHEYSGLIKSILLRRTEGR